MSAAASRKSARPTAEVYDLRKMRPRRPIPVPPGACRIVGSFQTHEDRHFVHFALDRRGGSVNVSLTISTGDDLHQWDPCRLAGYVPSSFADARAWVQAYVAGFGQVLKEHVRERSKMAMPRGEDRKLLKLGGCRESWLRSDVPHLWAQAVMKCQHPGQFCGQDGYCHLGDCEMEMDPLPIEDEDAPEDPTEGLEPMP